MNLAAIAGETSQDLKTLLVAVAKDLLTQPRDLRLPSMRDIAKAAGVSPGATRVTALWVALHGLVSLRIHKTGMPWQTTIEQDVDTLLKALLRP